MRVKTENAEKSDFFQVVKAVSGMFRKLESTEQKPNLD
jgi:hypothetical protein